jgi:hypothetical protein
VVGSRDYRAFETYLLPAAATDTGIDGETDPDRYVAARADALHEHLTFVAARAERGELDGVEIEDGKLYIARTKPAVPDAARLLANQLEGLPPRVRITWSATSAPETWPTRAERLRLTQCGDGPKFALT